MEGGNTKKVFIWLVICALVIQIVPVNITGDTWVQTTQEDFEGGETWNTNVTLSPGNVTLEPSPTDWIKGQGNPIIDLGPTGSFDDFEVGAPSVIYENGTYKMWYTGIEGSAYNDKIGYATSSDGFTWNKYPENPVLRPSPLEKWDDTVVRYPYIIFNGVEYLMYYSALTSSASPHHWRIGVANSSDGINWEKYPLNPVVDLGPPSSWDNGSIHSCSVVYNDGLYQMWYSGSPTGGIDDGEIGYATSMDGYNWTKYPGNPVFLRGGVGTWDSLLVVDPMVRYDNGVYHLWYTGRNAVGNNAFGYATSNDGINWTKYPNNPILTKGAGGSWDSTIIWWPYVLKIDNIYRMWYRGDEGTHTRIGHAISYDGINWTKRAANPVLNVGENGEWDDYWACMGSILKEGNVYKMWYTGCDGTIHGATWMQRIGYAESIDGIYWEKNTSNPVLELGSSDTWDDGAIFSCSVINDGGTYKMWYAGHDGSRMRIGYAISDDGINWIKYDDPTTTSSPYQESDPVINIASPGDWDYDCLEPRVIKDGSIYKMWYNGWDGSHRRVGLAISDDGINWTKSAFNPVFTPDSPCKWDNDHVIAGFVQKESTLYEMWYSGLDGYFSSRIGYATSIDGINWTRSPLNPIVDKGETGTWDRSSIHSPSIIRDGHQLKMWYSGWDGTNHKIGYATAAYGSRFIKEPSNPVMDLPTGIRGASLLSVDSEWKMWYYLVTGNIGFANSSDGIYWDQYPGNPILSEAYPSVTYNGSGYRMYYHDFNLATSPDGITWTSYSGNPLLTLGPPGSWDSGEVGYPWVMIDEGFYKMWYIGQGPDGIFRLGYATSPDGLIWTKYSGNPIMEGGPTGSWDEASSDSNMFQPCVTRDGSVLRMIYTGPASWSLGIATSLDGGITWVKSALNPVLKPGSSGSWDASRLLDAHLALNNETYKLWYSGDLGTDDHDIGYAETLNLGTGTYESSIYDSGYNGTFWNSISWSETLPPNTLITLSLRTGDTSIPDSTWTNWSAEIYDSMGSLISQPRSRYIQYRTTLISLDAKDTPILEDVTINYGLNTATPPTLISPPNDLWTTNNTPTFTWTYEDTDGDLQGGYIVEIDNDPLFGSIDYTSGDVFTAGEEWAPSLSISDGTWYWRVKTMDEYGLWSDWGENWTINIDTTPPDPPIDPIATPDDWTNINSFTVDWTNSSDFSGVKEGCWYKIGSPPTSNSDGTWQGSKPITISSLENEQTIYIWLEDNLGNTNYFNYSSVILYLDTVPPSISHTPPTSGTIGEPITINAIITDNVAVKSAILYYRKTGDTNWSSVSMTQDGDSYSAEIPASVVTMAGVQYYISASDEINTVKYPSFAPPNNYFNLTIVDTVPPIISHTPITNGTENQTITISATITDNAGVTEAILYYRIKGTSTWSSIPMTQTVNVFSADIPNSDVTPKGIEYYIFATDSIFNATHPEEDPQTVPHEITVTQKEIPDDGEPEPNEEEMDFLTSWWWLLLLFFIVVVILVFLLARRRGEEMEVGPIAEEEPIVEEVGEIISEEEPQPELPEETELPKEESKLTEELEELEASETSKEEKIPSLPSQDISDDEIFENIKKKYEEGKLSKETFEDFKKRYGKE